MIAKHIFVFGSNLGGIHGAGSAKEAWLNHGAVRGVGSGRTGNSFAIPTKDHQLRTLPLDSIRLWVRSFVDYSNAHRELQFDVVEIGCGLAGYTPEQIAPFFKGCTSNVKLPKSFQSALQEL